MKECLSCGSTNSTQCLRCSHLWCTDCEAGGYCDCRPPQDDKCLTCGGEGCDK